MSKEQRQLEQMEMSDGQRVWYYARRAGRILTRCFMAYMILQGIMGVLVMSCFIREEAIQVEQFASAIPAMNKEWEIAYSIVQQEEEHVRANSRSIRQMWQFWNVVLPWRLYGHVSTAFKAYGEAAERKLDNDIDFYRYMVNKTKQTQLVKERGW